MIFRLKGVKKVTAKGNTYYYHRKTMGRIHAKYGTAEFIKEFHEYDQQKKSTSSATPGTWGFLVQNYKLSSAYLELAARTKQDYNKVFDYLHRDHDTLIEHMTTASIAKLRDKTFKSRKRTFANYVVSVFSLVFNWAIDAGHATNNPAEKVKKIKRPKNKPKANRPWSEDEYAVMMQASPDHIKLAIALAWFTGIRQGDMCSLPWSAYDNYTINFSQQKTGAPLLVPVHKDLKILLDKEQKKKRGLYIVTHSRGQKYTESGFRASFFKIVREQVANGNIMPGLTFHGLRTSVATRLAEAGATENIIMAVTGHTSEAAVRVYTAAAKRNKNARRAINILEHQSNKSGKP